MSARSSVRVSGFMVVSQSWSAFISPRPLKRWVGQVLDLHLLDDAVAFLLVARVARDLAGAHAVERRLGDVEVARLDQLRHVAEEEGHQQRPDVGAVDVGVGQQDDLVIAQLRRCRMSSPMPVPSAMISGRIFSLAEHLVEARLLDVEHLAEHGQDGLEAAVAALLGRATGRVALDDVELAALRVALLAVGELAGQATPPGRSCGYQVARLAGGFARARGGERLVDDASAVARVLIEILARPSVTAAWTWPLTSALPSLALVCPSNWGSVSLTLMTAVRPSRTSSPERLPSCP